MTAEARASASGIRDPGGHRRILGIETEYGISVVPPVEARIDTVARTLFEPVVAWGGSSSVYVDNGSRLYLDVGSHPEYATAECDSVTDVIAYDRAGERTMARLVGQAQEAVGTLAVRSRSAEPAAGSGASAGQPTTSADGSRVCRWRSSSPRRRCACSPPRGSPSASRTACPC